MILFFNPDLQPENITLSCEESKHCIKSLRKKIGDEIHITDGNGTLATAEIISASTSDCVVHIVKRTKIEPRNCFLQIAVAPTKNSDRIEWFVEKAVEIGIERISFIVCEHSERNKMDLNRLTRIAVSALKQSQTTYLPKMEVIDFTDFISKYENENFLKYIAWCDDQNTTQLSDEPLQNARSIILIGPEGDFSNSEISKAQQANYKEIKLGSRRLRTETAALYSCCVVASQNA